MDNELQIFGIEETKLMLEEIRRDLITESPLMAAAAVVQRNLVDNAPRRPAGTEPAEREFPALQSSVITDIEVKPGRGLASTGFGDEAGLVALWNEYEHRIVTHTGRDTGKVTNPNPFMRKTTDQSAEEAIDAFSDHLAKLVKERYGR